MIDFNKTKYKIIESKNNICPYAIFVDTGRGFWQQCTKNYFYKGACVNKLKKLNDAYYNTSKIQQQFAKLANN